VLVRRKLANIVNVYFYDTCELCPANYSKIKDLPEKLRKNCQYIYSHVIDSFIHLVIETFELKQSTNDSI